jgi:hypothetical protein
LELRCTQLTFSRLDWSGEISKTRFSIGAGKGGGSLLLVLLNLLLIGTGPLGSKRRSKLDRKSTTLKVLLAFFAFRFSSDLSTVTITRWIVTIANSCRF